MQATMTCAGLDVHARSTHAAAIDLLTGELRRARLGAGTDPVVSWLGSLPGPVRAAYEAGPTGFGLARAAAAAGIEVIVAAPSKTPRAKGDRVKSDRKDAELLARLLVAGQLKAVAIPPDWLEAIRHVARTREQVRRDLGRARHRVSKLCWSRAASIRARRPGTPITVAGWPRSSSTSRPASWRSSTCSQPSTGWPRAAKRSMSACPGWRPGQRLWPTVARLRAFRGVDTLTALALHLELGGDWQRFASPRKPSSWLGLVPSLDQSGERLTQGSITKTGSSIARRLLVEAAWHYARAPRIGVTLHNRQTDQPDHILQIAWRAQHRLHRTHQRFKARGKPTNVATIAVARELAGFLWAAATAP
jgi:transposase